MIDPNQILEAEKLVNQSIEQSVSILETIVARDKQSGTNAKE